MDEIKKISIRTIKIVFSLFVIFFFIYGVYTIQGWINDTKPIVEFIGGEISHTEVRHFDIVVAYLNIRKTKDCMGVSQRRLTGQCGEIILSEAATYRPGGFTGRVTIPFQVPESVIPGPCAFQVRVWFICNPLDLIRDRYYTSSLLSFRVMRYDE